MIHGSLIEFMNQELRHTPRDFHRYMWNKIIWEARLIGLTGPRGVGKSTIVKQYMLTMPNRNEWLYVSADHSYFTSYTLMDLAADFAREGGRHLVIDEIHKYPGWSRELKMIYDGLPSLNVIFTGSSVLDIKKGYADLSRRALMFEMQGLSFREYLALFHDMTFPNLSLESVLANDIDIPNDWHPIPLLREYMKCGYYPFAKEEGFLIRMQQMIAQTIEVDIPQYAGMNVSTANKLKKMLSVISSLAPYKPKNTNLATELKVSKNDVPDYLFYLEKAGMIGQLRDDIGGMRGLGKVEKVYVDNTNLMYALSTSGIPDIGKMRETFFFNQVRVCCDVQSSKISNFRIGDLTFEIGGRNKTRRQLREASDGYVVKDDLEFGFGKTIPLWLFGLLY